MGMIWISMACTVMTAKSMALSGSPPVRLPGTPRSSVIVSATFATLILQHMQMKGRDQRSLPNNTCRNLDFFLVFSSLQSHSETCHGWQLAKHKCSAHDPPVSRCVLGGCRGSQPRQQLPLYLESRGGFLPTDERTLFLLKWQICNLVSLEHYLEIIPLTKILTNGIAPV